MINNIVEILFENAKKHPQKLAIIQQGIQEIKQLLDIQQSSELEAAILMLQDLVNHREYIQNDANRVQAALTKLHDLKQEAQKSILICKKQIDVEQNGIDIKMIRSRKLILLLIRLLNILQDINRPFSFIV